MLSYGVYGVEKYGGTSWKFETGAPFYAKFWLMMMFFWIELMWKTFVELSDSFLIFLNNSEGSGLQMDDDLYKFKTNFL